ncbi:MAG TPA: metallophosphoesterase family protein, partial [Pyrinomonadaceae bacterium]|nr:metallophosphoesterase family protein [Pyrinomonadaceae bacterium]
SDQGTAWRATSFNDLTWPSGPAQLGYGDGDEATTLGFGPDGNNKFITSYFRRSFTVTNAALFNGLTLRLMRDDGAVVYLNGVEVWRTNMPTGTVGFLTPASVAIAGADESTFVQTTISPALLVTGTNVLAVELHQSGGTSTDISFDLQLIGSDSSASVTRGPYLQIGTPNSTVVRWRTNIATDSRISYGTTQGSLTTNTDNATQTTEHEVVLSNLSPATKYFYSVGSTTQTLAGNNSSHFFVTSPVAGTASPTRIWILGDSGTANANAQAVRNAYLNFTGSTHTNLWLMLGDNAYETGTDSEYQAAVFDMYPTTLRQSVLWPTIGNHDTAQSTNPPASLPYFSMFTLPANAQAGGMASGTEKYYSFDYANIHFICLDSMTSDRSVNGPMATWLRADLASSTRQWTIAFWHHPPYSKGSHDSDTESFLVQMRQNFLPILEEAGVDLVLAGHSHSYERSYLIDGHYGLSSTFTNAMKKDGGSGRPDVTGAYSKPTLGPGTHEGAVYAVAG